MVEATHGRMQIPKYIPQFDGLRGIAILIVLLAHLSYIEGIGFAGIFKYGRTGVDLFFVLSGFLITGILLDTKELAGYFRNFYARRALRIWPLYYSVLLVVFVLLAIFPNREYFFTDVKTWPYYLTYTQNLFYHFQRSTPLGPTWSLAVEEQYYMVWAPVVFLCGRKTLINVLLGMILFSFCFRVASLQMGKSLDFVYTFTLCRLEPLAVGGLAAIWLRSETCTYERWNRVALIALMTGLSGVLLSLADWPKESSVYGYPFLAAVFGGTLALSLTADAATTFVGRALTQRWLMYTGRISYGVYLIHVPIYICVSRAARRMLGQSVYPRLTQVLIVCAAFAAVYAVASISWVCFERPILKLKEKFRAEKPMLEGAAAR